jgi:transglutaminase/protease-like cytokinesis protein 3
MKRLTLILTSCLFSCLLFAQSSIDWDKFASVAAVEGATVAELATNITAGFTTEVDKAAAIYYWMTHNIAYDTKMLEKMRKEGFKRERLPKDEVTRRKHEQVQYAFEKHKGVCQNYARFFLQLCNGAGLESTFVSGHSRGNVMKPGILGVGHAWNVVKIDGDWALVDATWGAGGINSKGRFVFNFKPGYFLPDPDSFSYSHLPTDPEWQLVDTVVTEEQFLRQPAVGVGFLNYGLRDLNYDVYRLELKKGNLLRITFKASESPGEILCVNMTSGKQIPCTTFVKGKDYTVTLPRKQVRNMVFNLRNEKNEPLVTYRLFVR